MCLRRLANYFQVVWMHQPGWRQCLAKLRPGSAAPPPPSGALQIYEPGFWLPRLGRPAWLARLTAQRRFQQVVRPVARPRLHQDRALSLGAGIRRSAGRVAARFQHLQRE